MPPPTPVSKPTQIRWTNWMCVPSVVPSLGFTPHPHLVASMPVCGPYVWRGADLQLGYRRGACEAWPDGVHDRARERSPEAGACAQWGGSHVHQLNVNAVCDAYPQRQGTIALNDVACKNLGVNADAMEFVNVTYVVVAICCCTRWRLVPQLVVVVPLCLLPQLRRR